MTNTRQKPVGVRNARRRRFINVVNLFRERYKCTANEAYGIAVRLESENKSLKDAVVNVKEENKQLKEENNRLKTEIDILKNP